MSDEQHKPIAPGFYTKKTFPPLSPGARKILEKIYAELGAHKNPQGESGERIVPKEA